MFEIVVIGGGARGMSLISHLPSELFHSRSAALFDWPGPPGAGVLRQGFAIESNSNTRKFFQPFSTNGLLAPLLTDEVFQSYLQRTDRTSMVDIAAGLDHVGSILLNELEKSLLYFPMRVETIVKTNADEFLIQSGNSTVCKARKVVLATGRRERDLILADALSNRVTKSNKILCNGVDDALFFGRDVHVVGASHSAFSVVAKLLSDDGLRPRTITLHAKRTPIPFFENLELARVFEQQIGQSLYDDKRHVCARTGQVARDTGIRGTGRQLLIDWYHGLRSFDILVEPEFDPSAIKGSDAIISAIGYEPCALRIETAGECYDLKNCTRSPTSELADPDGRLIENLFCLRTFPTPKDERDRLVENQRVQEILALRMLEGGRL